MEDDREERGLFQKINNKPGKKENYEPVTHLSKDRPGLIKCSEEKGRRGGRPSEKADAFQQGYYGSYQGAKKKARTAYDVRKFRRCSASLLDEKKTQTTFAGG